MELLIMLLVVALLMLVFCRPEQTIIIVTPAPWNDEAEPGNGCLGWVLLGTVILIVLVLLTATPS